jgi:hypothetical protein
MDNRRTLISEFTLIEKLGVTSVVVFFIVVAIGIVAVFTRRRIHAHAASILILASLLFGLADIARRIFQVLHGYATGRLYMDPAQFIGEIAGFCLPLMCVLIGCGIGLLLVAVSVMFSKNSAVSIP